MMSGPLLLMWINFYSSREINNHISSKVRDEIVYLLLPLYYAYNNLSMLGLKLIHVNKRPIIVLVRITVIYAIVKK